MLILTRRVCESVMIGSDIKVTILGVKGNQVRIGFDAPPDVAVNREEIAERIRQEQIDQKLNRIEAEIEARKHADDGEPAFKPPANPRITHRRRRSNIPLDPEA